MSAPRPQSRIKQIAQAVAEQIEAEHARAIASARKDREARRLEHRLRVAQHAPPGGLRRLRAQAEIGQRGFGEDGGGELDGRLHDQGRRDIGQHVFEAMAVGPSPATRAASANSRASTLWPTARVTLAKTGTLKMPIARIALTRPGPKNGGQHDREQEAPEKRR